MADKILNSFDVWITAQGWKSKLRLKSIDNISLEGIARLRKLILELAVRGRLVPQEPSDESASALLKKIIAQREQLVKQGKIKTQKSLTDVSDDEKLYEIPLGWAYCRFGALVNSITSGGTPSKSNSEYWNGDIPWASVKDLGKSKYLETTQDFITQAGLDKGSKLADKDDLIICTRMGLGKIAIAKTKVAINQDLKAVKLTSFLSVDFFLIFFATINIEGTGTTVEGIRQEELLNYVVTLPPLAEQHRIVAKVDELMALCDELEQQETNHLKSHQLLVETLLGTLTQAKDAAEFQTAWATLAQYFDDLFITEDSIDQLKQTILQLAVMGKLVPQDPKDEPASELLKKIAKEKERLVEEGVIKKEKSLPDIQDTEIPFKAPASWAFARLGEISNKIGSGSTPRGGRESYTDKGILFLRSQNIYDHGLELSDVAYISAETHEKMGGTKVYPNDILLNITGGSLGRSTIFPDDVGEANVSQHVTIIRPTNPQTRFFLHLCIMSPYGQGLIWGRQVGANREGLSKKILELFEFPIPPAKEQNRIITKVDELFALCDHLKERIAESQKVVNQMADSILEQVD